ncbi:MAG: DUF5652 family protein [Patescibacteria group bacterium]
MYFQQLTNAQLIAILNNPKAISFLIALALWSLAWKGVALWKAAKNDSKPWYIALLVFNTVGILEILYVSFFSKRKK